MKTLKPIKKLLFTIFLPSTMLAVILALSMPVFAYEEDTHFVMTYVICRSVGFTPDEAMIVAAVDQGMDDSPGTVAAGGIGGVIPNVDEEALWHALDGYGYTQGGTMKVSGILARRDQLFQDALKETTLRNKLIRLGVFFHYQEDIWAHRHHYVGALGGGATYDPNHLSENNYTTYETPLGHGLVGHQPDRPPFDPVAALMDLQDGIIYARRFLKDGLGREPNPFLANYVSQGGSDDGGWSEKDTYVHQISLSGAAPKSARLYLLSLIRKQIDVYTYSDSEFGFLFDKASSEADISKTRSNLEPVWNQFKDVMAWGNIVYPDLIIPTRKQKEAQGFTNLTTKMLKAKLPVTPQFVGVGTDNLLWTKETLDSTWVKAPVFGRVISIAIMKNGTILGVGTDNLFYARPNLSSGWVPAPNPGAVLDVAVMPDGTILGVGTDHLLWTKATLASVWVKAPVFGLVISVAIMPDGTILGVGTDNLLYTRANLNSNWVPAPSSRPISSVAVMQDGTILGTGTDNLLYKRANLKSNWVAVPKPGAVISVAEMPLAK